MELCKERYKEPRKRNCVMNCGRHCVTNGAELYGGPETVQGAVGNCVREEGTVKEHVRHCGNCVKCCGRSCSRNFFRIECERF